MHFGWPRGAPVEAAEQRWLEEACALALAASLEIHGPDAIDSQIIDVGVVGRAAEQVWAAMPGAPSWVLLDVGALIARLDREMPGMRDNLVATLITFVHWLAANRLLSTTDSLLLLARLDPFVPEIFRAMGYRPAPVPASLRPC